MIRQFILSFAVALLVAHCSPVKAAAIVQAEPMEAPEHMEDSKIFNIRPLLENAPKTQKNVKFSALAAEDSRQQKRALSNSELFEKLGLQKLHISSGQQKKRLAVQSRHHGHPDDSHMFIIKLPPNNNYYGSFKSQSNSPNSIADQSRKINMGFQSNGKLGAIYHWNLPVLKKMLKKNHHKSHNPNYRHVATAHEDDELLDIKNIPTWSDPWQEVHDGDKQYREELEKKYKKKAPVYYAPQKKNKKVQKYFPGNGKPKSFYVMKKSKSPAHFQKLIA